MKRLDLNAFKNKPSIKTQDISTLLGQVLGDCHTSERIADNGDRYVTTYDDDGEFVSVTVYHTDGTRSVVD